MTWNTTKRTIRSSFRWNLWTVICHRCLLCWIEGKKNSFWSWLHCWNAKTTNQILLRWMENENLLSSCPIYGTYPPHAWWTNQSSWSQCRNLAWWLSSKMEKHCRLSHLIKIFQIVCQEIIHLEETKLITDRWVQRSLFSFFLFFISFLVCVCVCCFCCVGFL